MLDRIIISLLESLSQPVEFVHCFYRRRWCICAIYLIWLNNCFSQMFCNIFFLSNICWTNDDKSSGMKLNVMGKGKRLKDKRKGFLSEFSDRLTSNFQRGLRNSELWDQMVAEFGETRAEEFLRECKAEVKPGLDGDGSGDSTKDIS